MLKSGERMDDLNLNGLFIIQHKDKFKFGLDAVLLANFVSVKKGDRIVDLGCGTGIIPIIIAAKSRDTYIYGIEIQEYIADMAFRSVKLNDMSDRINIINGDIRHIANTLGYEKFDIVTANPPYMPYNTGFKKLKESENISRYEICGGLEDFVKTACELLKFGGKFFMVHRADRIVDIIYVLRKYNIEPKKMRFVHPRAGSRPNLLLIEAKKGSKTGLNIMEPLYVYKEDGAYTQELLDIYGKTALEEE